MLFNRVATFLYPLGSRKYKQPYYLLSLSLSCLVNKRNDFRYKNTVILNSGFTHFSYGYSDIYTPTLIIKEIGEIKNGRLYRINASGDRS